jgi:hypothetical protein
LSPGGRSGSSSSGAGKCGDELIETNTGMRLRKLSDGTYELLGDLNVRGCVKVDGGLTVAGGIQV